MCVGVSVCVGVCVGVGVYVSLCVYTLFSFSFSCAVVLSQQTSKQPGSMHCSRSKQHNESATRMHRLIKSEGKICQFVCVGRVWNICHCPKVITTDGKGVHPGRMSQPLLDIDR